jgi:hypothetical protein
MRVVNKTNVILDNNQEIFKMFEKVFSNNKINWNLSNFSSFINFVTFQALKYSKDNKLDDQKFELPEEIYMKF